MTPHGRRPGLAGALLLHAAGLTSDTAAAELICAHHTWLARADFVTGYIDAGTRHDGHPYAYIDWERAVAALDTRNHRHHSYVSAGSSLTLNDPNGWP